MFFQKVFSGSISVMLPFHFFKLCLARGYFGISSLSARSVTVFSVSAFPAPRIFRLSVFFFLLKIEKKKKILDFLDIYLDFLIFKPCKKVSATVFLCRLAPASPLC